MEFKENIENEICLVQIEGELTIYHVNDFKKNLDKAIKNASGLRLDLSAVSEIDTSCMQLLMQAQNACLENEKQFELISVSPAVQEVIDIFGLHHYFFSAKAS